MMANAPKDLSAQDYRKMDQAHAWHPLFQHQLLDQSDLLVFESANGTTIIDADGNEYLDAYSALWNVNVGYGRQEIADAVYEQIQKLPYYPHAQINIPATLLAERLTGLLPGNLKPRLLLQQRLRSQRNRDKNGEAIRSAKISRRESLQDYQSLSRVSRLHIRSDVRNGSNPSSQSV